MISIDNWIRGGCKSTACPLRPVILIIDPGCTTAPTASGTPTPTAGCSWSATMTVARSRAANAEGVEIADTAHHRALQMKEESSQEILV